MKRIICMVVVLLQIIGVLSCSGSKENDKMRECTQRFINNMINYDFDEMKKQVSDKESVIETEKRVKTFIETEFKDRKVSESSVSDEEQKQHIADIYKDMTKVIQKMDVSSMDEIYFEFLSNCAKKTTYDIKEIDSNNMTVNVSFSYIDTKKILDEIITKCVTIIYEKGDSDYEMSATLIKEYFEKKIKEANEKLSGDNDNLEYVKEDLYINFEKDILITSIDKDLQKVIEIGTKKNVDIAFEENEKQIAQWFEQTKKEVEEEMKS